MRLYLVRHGQTEWNVNGRAQGHTDIDLDEVGKEQARCLAQAFQEICVSKVVTSDLKRAYNTARAVHEVSGGDFIVDPRLRERSFGEWEGLHFEEVLRRRTVFAEQGGDPFDHRPPGGESMQDVWDRISAIVDEIDTASEALAIVTHGGSLSVLLAQLLRANGATSRSFRFGNTALTELDRHPDGHYTLIRFNDTSHLKEMKSIEGSMDGTHR